MRCSAVYDRDVARLICSFTFLAASLFTSGPAAQSADKTAGTLTVSDAVTAPGRPVMLQARLVRADSLIEMALGGEPLDFFVSGRKIGTAMTGGDGRAFLEFTPRMRGNQTLTVRLGPSTRVSASEATATVAAWEKRRPLLLVEHSALMEPQATPGPVPGLGLVIPRQDPAPASGAADELKRLSEFYFNVVYIERPDDKFPEARDFREWLQHHGFPFGLRLKVKDDKAGSLAQKLDELRAEGWERLKAGVGRNRTFAEELLQQRVHVILLIDESDLPRKAQRAKDWREVRKLLQG